MIESLMIALLECVCDNYCNCESCKEDDSDCPLENELKSKLRESMKEYLEEKGV